MLDYQEPFYYSRRPQVEEMPFLKRYNSILLNKRLTNNKEMFHKSSQLQPINGKNFSSLNNVGNQ